MNQNTGMISVDTAALSLFRRPPLLSDFKPTFFIAGRSESFCRIPDCGEIQYHALNDPEQLESFDKILFWGDFLHSRRYFEIAGLDKDLVHRCLLLSGSSQELRSKVVSFGTSMYINTLEDQTDEPYRRAIGKLYRDAAAVMMRDPISADHAMRLSGYAKTDTLGIDCAFLLDSAHVFEWAGLPPRNPAGHQPQVGYSFGRSVMKDRMVQYTRGIAAGLGAGVVNIEWNRKQNTDRLTKLANKIDIIRGCEVVVTDTYHCAINSWREGIPTICIGMGAEHARLAIGDKKKELMYLSFNMADLYVFSERLMYLSALETCVETTLDVLGKCKAVILPIVQGKIQSAETRLIAALAQ
jgi:hypothetical protein